MPVSDPIPKIENSVEEFGLDLTLCDREPIHVPGSIQPHGLLLIADAETVVAGAGAIETRLHPEWLRKHLDDLVLQDVAALLEPSRTAAGGILSAVQVRGLLKVFDISLHRSGGLLLVELEPAAVAASPSGAVLAMRNSLGRSIARIAGGQAGPNRHR